MIAASLLAKSVYQPAPRFLSLSEGCLTLSSCLSLVLGLLTGSVISTLAIKISYELLAISAQVASVTHIYTRMHPRTCTRTHTHTHAWGDNLSWCLHNLKHRLPLLNSNCDNCVINACHTPTPHAYTHPHTLHTYTCTPPRSSLCQSPAQAWFLQPVASSLDYGPGPNCQVATNV